MPLPRREPKPNLSVEVAPRYPEIVSAAWEDETRTSLRVVMPDGTEWANVTESSAADKWAAAHLGEIGDPEIRLESIEPIQADTTQRRLQEVEDTLAWLMEPGEPEPEYIDLSERADPDVVGGLEAEEDPALVSIPGEFRGMLLDDESPEKFTERMRRRYRYLKHMQMDASKPTSARALPDMTDEERVEMESMQARGAEAVAWLERE